MLSIESNGDLNEGVYVQYLLRWEPPLGAYTRTCRLNVWVGGCCGFNMLSNMGDICLNLNQEQFDLFMEELRKVFKEREDTRLQTHFVSTGRATPPYSISQVFFLYGDVPDQRDAFSKLIAIGKEVHRYVSGSEPGHDTVMISIDL